MTKRKGWSIFWLILIGLFLLGWLYLHTTQLQG